MRVRAWLSLCLLMVVAAAGGCRKPLTPTFENNKAPETWITAAPQDTITIRVPGEVPDQTAPGTIPFRFHLYWAGADEDGAVVGFYWAVTETSAISSSDPSQRPPLPGPKPQQYRFTARTDSVFDFAVFEDFPDRQHVFYIYAVDDKGRVDATPARFIFNSLDQFPPVPIITLATATADVFDIRDVTPGGGPYTPRRRVYTIRDSFAISKPTTTDTVPIGATLSFNWTSEERLANHPAVRFKYKLDEPSFIEVPATVTSKQYGGSEYGPGSKIFTLRAIDGAGGARTDPETNRFFQANFSPDTWFAGPDPNQPGFYTYETPMFSGPQIYRQLTGSAPWQNLPAFPGSLLSPDSNQVFPVDRVPRKTFFEIYGNRVYVRAEDDTVNANSWVLFFGGGFDSDSPYLVRVDGFALNPSAGPVVQKDSMPNASPTGFRLVMPLFLYPAGQSNPAPSQVFPLDEALEVPEPHIGGYISARQSGRAYAQLRAVDGTGGLTGTDSRISNPRAFVDSIEKGLIPPGSPRYPLRSRVLTFFINRAPYLLTDQPAFQPRPPFTYASRTITLNLLSKDDDPVDPLQSTVGGPPPGTVTTPLFRYTVKLRGRNSDGRDTLYTPPGGYDNADVPPTSITVPNFMVGTSATILVELCDFPDPSRNAGTGRCRSYEFPVTVPPPPASSRASSASQDAGPGDTGRSSGRTFR